MGYGIINYLVSCNLYVLVIVNIIRFDADDTCDYVRVIEVMGGMGIGGRNLVTNFVF